MVVFPNAKINIGLDIIEKRSDEYHNLSSIFYPIRWSDVLEIIPSSKFHFRCTGISISEIENSCIKAYHLVRSHYKIPQVYIHLHKVIPIGAGLGGGSSDGAFTLKLLNSHFNLQIPDEKIYQMSVQIGSDCPFFLQNKVSYISKKESFSTEINLSLKGKYIFLIYPNVHISTKEAYSYVIPQKPYKSLIQLIKKPILEWRNWIKNDFQNSIIKHYPIIGNLIQMLYKKNALFASLTGSGSVVYGIFDKRQLNWDFPKDFLTWQEKLC